MSALVLGLGGTVDYEIEWDAGVLEALAIEHGVRVDELDPAVPIVDERSLLVSLLGFLGRGIGGERFVASSDILEAFAARFTTRITLGGTCVRAAIAMETLGVPAVLHLVSIDDHVRRLLPPGSRYICSADADSTDPHVIVQFGAGATVRVEGVGLTAPHPNRLIYVNDPPNRELRLSDRLGDELAEAELFLISGFNTIQDPAVLEARITRLREHLTRLPEGALVMFEDAGYHDPALSARVLASLIDAVDVISLNEDELQARLGRELDLLDPDAIERALRDLGAMIPAPTLVVHTRYWALAYGDDAARWHDALQGAITMAATRYLHGDGHTGDDYRQMARSPVSAAGLGLATELERRLGGRVRVLPAFALDPDRPTTIGLGDTFVGGFIAAIARRNGGTRT